MASSADRSCSVSSIGAQGYLKLPNGRALGGRSHDYKRNGSSTLFAALEVATGKVTAGHYKRRRRVEFLDFMNGIIANYPGKTIHVILNNLSTHKPKRDRWLARHPNVRFHFTPTYSSWLNQIEICSPFSRATPSPGRASPSVSGCAACSWESGHNDGTAPLPGPCGTGLGEFRGVYRLERGRSSICAMFTSVKKPSKRPRNSHVVVPALS
jgi:hypothetical protein